MKKLIVLDANILIRATLGNRVFGLLSTYGGQAGFFAPEACYAEMRMHLPLIAEKRKLHFEPFASTINRLTKVVLPVEEDVYSDFEEEAKRRLHHRDLRDWPSLALALALDCPIWTEDSDYFGTGVATWQTDTVEIYLSQK